MLFPSTWLTRRSAWWTQVEDENLKVGVCEDSDEDADAPADKKTSVKKAADSDSDAPRLQVPTPTRPDSMGIPHDFI